MDDDAKNTYQGVREQDPSAQVVQFARGRAAVGDGGEGLFFWDPQEVVPAFESAETIDTTFLVPSPPASGRWKRGGTGINYDAVSGTARHSAVLNVRWFGAKGNGQADDHGAIQAALNEVAVRGGTLYFPPGRYKVSDTLDAGDAFAVRYQGGAGSPDNRIFSHDVSSGIPKSPTALIWAGAAGGTLFRWSGRDCVFDGLAFHGRIASASTRAGVGFQLAKSAATIASGKAWLPSIHIADCDVAFQCGLPETGDCSTDPDLCGNCDVLTFGRFTAVNCGSGFRVANDQGQNYVFLSCRFENVGLPGSGACFDFVRGGALNVSRMTAINTPLLLNVESGQNGASGYRLGFVSLGPQTGRVVWVRHITSSETQADDAAHIIIDGGDARAVQVPTPTVAAFQIRGRAVLTVRNVNGGLTGATNQPLFDLAGTSANTTTVAVFENCGLDGFDPDSSDPASVLGTFVGGGAKRWLLRDCYRGANGRFRLPDLGNLGSCRAGSGTIASQATSVVVAHNLFTAAAPALGDGVRPTVILAPRVQGQLWVTDVTATSFTVNRSAGGPALSFDWWAEVDA